MTEPVAVAVLAKAPLAGFAKTRLIPLLGAERAAQLQARLIAHAIATAISAAVGPITLWGTPDVMHPCFTALQMRGIAVAPQGEGDLGARMLEAVTAAKQPVLVVGTDCPVLTPEHLRKAAELLRSGTDVVVYPAEDGGYVLIGMRQPEPSLFDGMAWGCKDVMNETRKRLHRLGRSWQEPVTLWDLDRPEDLERLRHCNLAALVAQ
ncbi:MAG: TIGR04282 family arsenosugar biosynthesis glycosyltransferase [Xanthobacteraceae bacterium]